MCKGEIYVYLLESGWGFQQCGGDILGADGALVNLKDNLIH